MNKLALISLISLIMCVVPVYADVNRSSDFYEDNEMEALQEEFFENGSVRPYRDNVPAGENFDNSVFRYGVGSGSDAPKLKGMPLFKKYRIKMTNYYRIKTHQEELKRQKEEELLRMREDEQLGEISDEEFEELKNRTIRKIYKNENDEEVKISHFEKFKNLFKRNKTDKTDNAEVKSDKKEAAQEPSDTELELSGGVKEVVAQKDIVLDCDKMNYDDTTQELEATGNPVLSFPPQGVIIKADRLVYNTASNVIKAYDNVEILKDGSTINGDYIQINMNDETALVTNMKASKMNMLINAKNVTASEDSIILEDGSMHGEKNYILYLRSRMIGPRLEHMIIPEDERSSITGTDGLQVKVKADEVYVTAKKGHDVMTVKNADIYIRDNYITRLSSFTAHTNKNHEYFEANYPELGSKPRLGMFIGPGFVFDTPVTDGTFKFIPFLNYKNDLGVGAALKYRSGTNYTEAYYGSAADIFVLKGRQFLDDRLYLQYGINSYIENWWMGSGMSKYQAELVYRDATVIPNTLGAGRSARYRQRISAGYAQEATYNRKNEHIDSGNMATTRFKYMAELNQRLFSYRHPEKLIRADLSWLLQGSVALYGTGDTQFIGRTGPMIHTQYKRWMQDIGYLLSGFDDQTPLPKFDTYRYGRSSLFARESLRLNKYLTLSWVATANLSDDAPNGKLFQENGFYLAIGPDDLKLMLGYDVIREQTIFLFTTCLDMKGTSVDYKKMVIKNPDRLARDESEKVELINFDQSKPQRVRRTYAEVINIEDPDREQIQ